MRLRALFPRIHLLFFDSCYAAKFVDWVLAFADGTVKVVKRSEDERKDGFVILKKRWIVERTFAWLTKFRHLVRNYE